MMIISIFMTTFLYAFIAEDSCNTPIDDRECNEDTSVDERLDTEISPLIKSLMLNKCLADKKDLKRSGIKIPKCQDIKSIAGLDNTYPSTGIFATYEGHNTTFLKEFITAYFKSNNIGIFNLILPLHLEKEFNEIITSDQEFRRILEDGKNKKRINIVPVRVAKGLNGSWPGKWTQDHFQFLTDKDGNVNILQMNHFKESILAIQDRIACQIAKECNIPYFVPGELDTNTSTLNSGGNLEFLPGGTPYIGVREAIRKKDSNLNHPPERSTPTQIQLVEQLEKEGRKVLELDVSFLDVQHVDEFVNIVKTKDKEPCDYAVLIASPKKAYQLLDDSNKNNNSFSVLKRYIFSNLIASTEVAAPAPSTPRPCRSSAMIEDDTVGYRDRQYNNKCIGHETIEQFLLDGGKYGAIRDHNLNGEESIHNLIQKNLDLILTDLKTNTKCVNPEVIEIPAIITAEGHFVTANLVNSVVQTSPGQPSTVIAPYSFVKPFDDYTKKVLGDKGIKVEQVNDDQYFKGNGDVHCGTNSTLICDGEDS